MILRGPEEIKKGDIFYNVKRSSMLRVVSVHGEWADYLSWRPDGTRGSNRGKVKIKSLTLLPYFRAESVHVYTKGGSFGFGLTPEEEMRD